MVLSLLVLIFIPLLIILKEFSWHRVEDGIHSVSRCSGYIIITIDGVEGVDRVRSSRIYYSPPPSLKDSVNSWGRNFYTQNEQSERKSGEGKSLAARGLWVEWIWRAFFFDDRVTRRLEKSKETPGAIEKYWKPFVTNRRFEENSLFLVPEDGFPDLSRPICLNPSCSINNPLYRKNNHDIFMSKTIRSRVDIPYQEHPDVQISFNDSPILS